MDESLDQFFAKKDKKKGKKSKSKMVSSDLLPAASTPTPPNESNDNVDNLNEQMADTKIGDTSSETHQIKEKKRSKRKKDKDGGEGGAGNEDDEWNDMNDEVDYSGLRIATKNIAKEAADEAAEQAARSEPEYDEDGQIIEKVEGAVWKLPVNPNPVEETETPAPEPTPVIAEMPNVTGGRYVPPSKRAGAAGSELQPVSIKGSGMNRRGKKVAPNVNSREDFPTLGAAPIHVDYDVSKFEKVRGGGSGQLSSVRSESSRVETSNMYSALERR